MLFEGAPAGPGRPAGRGGGLGRPKSLGGPGLVATGDPAASESASLSRAVGLGAARSGPRTPRAAIITIIIPE